MVSWVERFEEGFVSNDGDVVSITNKVHSDDTWESPTIALASWHERLKLNGERVSSYRNGFQQIDDVGDRPNFARLGVTRIWRRISFEMLNDTKVKGQSQNSTSGRDGHRAGS